MGGFVYLKKSLERFTFNGGIRFDTRHINVHELYLEDVQDTVFKGFTTNLAAFSGALGGTWKISNSFNMKVNLGRGYRAPNIAELSSNGVHEGTFRYELGNKTLKSETSLQLDGEISFRSRNIAVTLSGFYNSINNYIYQRNLDGETKEQDGSVYPVYRYVQGNSLLKGFELFADIHPRDNIHFENSFSYVHGENEDTHTPLPFIPAGHSKHTLRWVFKGNRILKEPYVGAGVDFVLAQKRYDLFETRTAGYTLLNFSLGTDVIIGHTKATIFVRGNNITNKRYYDHLNRLKYVGIYNPGRDITMGLILPFEWSAWK